MGGLLLLFQQSTAAGPAPDHDISLQLCGDLCSVYRLGCTVYTTAGLQLPLAQMALVLINWPEFLRKHLFSARSPELFLKECTCKHCIKDSQGAPVCCHVPCVQGGCHPTISGHGLSLVLYTAPTPVLSLPFSSLFSRVLLAFSSSNT